MLYKEFCEKKKIKSKSCVGTNDAEAIEILRKTFLGINYSTKKENVYEEFNTHVVADILKWYENTTNKNKILKIEVIGLTVLNMIFFYLFIYNLLHS